MGNDISLEINSSQFAQAMGRIGAISDPRERCKRLRILAARVNKDVRTDQIWKTYWETIEQWIARFDKTRLDWSPHKELLLVARQTNLPQWVVDKFVNVGASERFHTYVKRGRQCIQ